MRALWIKFRHFCEWLVLVSTAKLVPLLPRALCLYLANALGTLFAAFDFAGRKVARSNLTAAFGDSLQHRQRERLARQSYRHFVRTVIDLCWSPRLTNENFANWIEIVGTEEVLPDIRAGRGVIFTTLHYGNFEWAALVLGLHGLHALALAQEFKNPLIEPVFASLRKHSGNELTPRQGGIVRMYRALKRGRHVALVTDFTLKPNEPGVLIDCFGLKKYVTFAHAWLHQLTGAPIATICCDPLAGGRCRIIILPKLEFAKGTSLIEITQRCWDQMEGIVRQKPAPWAWMYKHWRYRLPGASKPYPFYAEIGPRFETQLNETMAKLAQEKV